ncbi:amidohydrolase/deacetylase family metallohydrolase [Alpinimonas psychrophila]|uniref:Dihydroorotase n=1 Tax=Alpinimonas psychrophila TaxID=748908 RepID=A0A7W3PNZ2_9MICO|nr:amidohydrolase/deacetylase family metallohydrolase [Alpinimonas psychrophila]MBA8828932.1 dihydroorotase [Alpinimonas psychrophila]
MTEPNYDSVVLRGGTVFEGEGSEGVVRDVRIENGKISGQDHGVGDVVIDVSGLVVAPGLVDMHTHVFAGQDLGVAADEVAFRSGTTTVLDAGSVGAHLIGAFRASTIDRSSVRVRAMLNISSIGATSIMLGGELLSPWYVSEGAAIDAIEANRDFVVGVKVRASVDVGGEHTSAALASARRVADHVGLPLMVHLGPSPASIDEIAESLRAGDIITHAFTGWPGNGILNETFGLRNTVRAARERGVLLDIGHGMSGFSLEVARHMLAGGEPPDTISTDIHSYSRESVIDLTTVLSKFLALGMTLPEVLRCASSAPAKALGLVVGTLATDSVADVAVLEREMGTFHFRDGFGGAVSGGERLRCVMTFSGGRLVHDRRRE